MFHNIALQSYSELANCLTHLSQANNIDVYLSEIANLKCGLKKVVQKKLFPIDLDCDEVDELLETHCNWYAGKIEVCKRLYVALASLLYRFEASNIFNRDYFDHQLELARTNFSFEEANDWGKEYVEDYNFSAEGFFFAINREKRFLHKSKTDYESYRQELRLKTPPNMPKEVTIPDEELKRIESCYTKYYEGYCNSIENFYPEIRDLFSRYNLNLRIYLCSYDPYATTPKVNFVLAYFYESHTRQVSVFPYYVDFCYRFFNIEDIGETLVDGSICIFKSEESIFNFIDIPLIHHEANYLFVGQASQTAICSYISYFLRAQLKNVEVLSDNELLCDGKTVLICNDDATCDKLSSLLEIKENCNFIFHRYPSETVVEFLKTKSVSWKCIYQYGQDMINNNNEEMVYWFIHYNIAGLNHICINRGANLLLEKLAKCKCGKTEWHDYELIGTEVFEYLFKDDFDEYQSKTQSETEDKRQRRDLVVNNTADISKTFWWKMKLDYGCKLIFVDFKNYEPPLNSDDIYNVTKYMNKVTGNFILIFSRNGVNDSGHLEQLRLLRESKLVLCLSDIHIHEMIQLKKNNKSPYLVLNSLLFELLQGI